MSQYNAWVTEARAHLDAAKRAMTRAALLTESDERAGSLQQLAADMSVAQSYLDSNYEVLR